MRKYEPFVNIPYYSLSPSSLTLFDRPDGLTYRGNSHIGFDNLLTNVNTFGEISAHAQQRLKRTIAYMLYITRERKVGGAQVLSKSQNFTTEYEKTTPHAAQVAYKLAFVTLTLPSEQQHPDQEIKAKCLNQFLIEAAKQWRMTLYIWKAEKQANGNIHFHILSNVYIPHKDLREVWNRIINKPPFFYVRRYSEKMQAYFAAGFRPLPNDKRTHAAQRKAYEANRACLWSNPNSTDIHALYKVKNVAAYISKYLAKDVTKTARIAEMKTILAELKSATESKDKSLATLEKYGIYSDTDPRAAAYLKPFQDKIAAHEARLHTLRKQGVAGRIWGCSTALSKCKSYVQSENWSDIPDIETVARTAHFYKRVDVGKSAIHTYAFNISRTPALKSLLDTHISQTVIKSTP